MTDKYGTKDRKHTYYQASMKEIIEKYYMPLKYDIQLSLRLVMVMEENLRGDGDRWIESMPVTAAFIAGTARSR